MIVKNNSSHLLTEQVLSLTNCMELYFNFNKLQLILFEILKS